jgi:arylsulfatase A-like enzyme
LPPEAYKYDDGAPEEPANAIWARTLPKPLNRVLPPATPGGQPQKYALWEHSPLPDEVLGRLAQGALTELKLGQGGEVDFLDVSFSSLDVVGHAYGPMSHEVQDVLARLDRVIGDLLVTLDRRVGRGNYVVALSADHGVAAFPERMRAQGEDAGRISMLEVRNRLNAAVVTELGPGRHVANISYTDIYLSNGVLDKLRARPGAIGRALDSIRGIPGVAAAFCTDDLRDPTRITDPVQRAAALSHHPARSGDFILVPKLNWLTVSSGTTHGSNHEYDQHVPVVFYGAGIRPGRYERPASPADVAPTLGRLVGVKMPQAEGSPLDEALVLSSAAVPRPPRAAKGRRARAR